MPSLKTTRALLHDRDPQTSLITNLVFKVNVQSSTKILNQISSSRRAVEPDKVVDVNDFCLSRIDVSVAPANLLAEEDEGQG
jgi:hypothetical protein